MYLLKAFKLMVLEQSRIWVVKIPQPATWSNTCVQPATSLSGRENATTMSERNSPCLALACGLLFVAATSFAQAPSSYSAYTGTDNKTVPPAPPLGPANSVITDPTFLSRILRATDANTSAGRSFMPVGAGFFRTWNSDSTAFQLTDQVGNGYWMEFDPNTFKVGDGSSHPVPHLLPFGANSARWEWSTRDPDKIYFVNGRRISWYNKSNQTTGDLGAAGEIAGTDELKYRAVVIGLDDWVCAPVDVPYPSPHSIQGTWRKLYCVMPNAASGLLFDFENETINGVFHGDDPNWPSPAPGQVLGIHAISGGTGVSWLSVTFHQQSWGGNGDSVVKLGADPPSWSLLKDAAHGGDPYWSGHHSVGNGKFTNGGGAPYSYGYDIRGFVSRDPDNLGVYSTFFELPPQGQLGIWCSAEHSSWLNSLTNPSAPVLISRYGRNCPYLWDGEIIAAAIDGSNVWRFAHNHNTWGADNCFSNQAFAQISNDGRWALFSSSWDGTLGTPGGFGCPTRIDTFIVALAPTGPPNTLSVVKQGNGSGIVMGPIADDGGMACPADCSETYESGRSVDLTAKSTDSTSKFIEWGGDCSGTVSTCTVLMNGPKTVTARFDALPSPSYTLTVSKTGAGGGTVKSNPTGTDCGVTCNANFSENTPVNLTATPDANSTFASWSGACSGSTMTCSVTMDTAKSITATFDVISTVTYIRVEQDSSSINYTGGWYNNNLAIHSSGSAKLARGAGYRSTFTFTGTSARWIGYNHKGSGIANVYVDGVLQSQVDTYYSTSPDYPQAQHINYTTTALLYGNHTLTIEVTGTKNSLSEGYSVWVDAFEYSGAGTPSYTRLDETSSSVAYTGNWYPNNMAIHNGGSAKLAMDTGSRVTFTFTGTSARWIGYNDEWSGIANVYIDGVFQTQVDTYYATPPDYHQAQHVNYTTPALAYGNHTLTIEVTGTRNTLSRAYWVWVDAFEYSDTGTPSFTRLEETSSSVAYTGDWSPDNMAIHSGGSANSARGTGYRATFTFTGTSARWIGYNDQWSGIANVYVDGVFQNQVDTYDDTPPDYHQAQHINYTTPVLAFGTHMLTVEVSGSKNASSQDYWVRVDAFEYSGTGTPSYTRFEQSSSLVGYSGQWYNDNLAIHSGGTAKPAMGAGYQATFTFTGTSARWIGYNDEWSGIAKVYVDGVFMAQADTYYGPPRRAQQVNYTTPVLAYGTHTLTIEVTYTKNASSRGYWVWIDAFEAAP